jgi:uncharacterized protein (DUF362 family)
MAILTRRRFLHGTMALGLGALVSACAPAGKPPAKEQEAQPVVERQEGATPAPTPVVATKASPATAIPATTAAKVASPAPAESAYMAVVHGADPEAMTMRALAALGGIERFVKNGYEVIVKPNMCNAYNGPEYASTTNPQVVATLVRMCLGAGAKRVRVMDYPFAGSMQNAYQKSGIEEAVKAAGGEMELMSSMEFVETPVPNGVDIKSWPVYRPVLEADLVVNVPIAKHHGSARLTLAAKNLMGVIENRGRMHSNLGQRIADIASLIRPQLTVVDAVRILMANGPTGGNLADVKEMNTIIASHDFVAADAYATSFFDMKPEEIAYIVNGAKMGLGTMDLASIKVEKLEV